MIYTLKNYQRDAVDELKKYFELYFNSNTKKEIIFKAPTGSGKTFIASSLFEELAEEYSSTSFCIMWACPGKGELHKQSFDAVKTYLGGNPVCSLLEDDFFGSRKFIKDKEIVFINWEKLIQKDRSTGKWANNLMKDQEGSNFMDVIDGTKKNGTKVILVVDESHIGNSQKARIQEFINTIIIPSIVLEMSATPLNNHIDVEVNPQEVIDEGMIKESIIVNEGIEKENGNFEWQDSELLILQKGYDKRNAIIEEYKKLNIHVNPLTLIQIPNVDEGEAKKLVIKDFLREKGITEDNGKLKFWCDDKGNFDKKAIKANNDITEYLVFKTSVATGWDCPRAHILIKFRESNSETFETQTVGRILRTAEAKSYGNYILDNAYIFTNIWSFETKQDTYNPNKIKTEWSKMRDGYNKMNVWHQTQLISFYRSRQKDYNSADSRYGTYLMRTFMNFFDLKEEEKYLGCLDPNIKAKIESKGLKLGLDVGDSVIEETKASVYIADNEEFVTGGLVDVQMSDNDIQAQYYNIIKENLNGLACVRSKSPINSAIIDIFSTFYNVFKRSEKVSAIMKIVVNNKEIFAQLISDSTREFKDLLALEAGKKGEKYDFKIEEARNYSLETHTELTSFKSLYKPLYVLKDKEGDPGNSLEKDFLKYLDNQNCVEWYWENGPELMKVNFGIPYNNGRNTFQPDFIVKFKNGTVGIFDTKPVNHRVEDTTIKSNALYKYLKETNKNRGNAPKVIGGIVVKQYSHFYIYDKDNYSDYSVSYNNWKNFDDLLREIDKEIEKIEYFKNHN